MTTMMKTMSRAYAMPPLGKVSLSERTKGNDMKYRIANHETPAYIAKLQPFQGSNLRADCLGGTYRVYSYWTTMLEVDTTTGETRYNERKYSRTTTRHQSYITRGLSMMGK